MARPVRAAASASAAKASLPSPSSSVVRGKRSAPQSQSSPSASARSKRQKKEDVQSDSDAIDEDDDEDDDDDLEVTSTSSEDSGDAADDYKDPGSGDAHESDDDEDGGDDDDSAMDDAELEDEELDSDAPKTKKNGSKGSKGKGRASSSATGNGSASKAKASIGKPQKEESSEDEEELLKDGRKIIRTKLVKAPAGHVKPGLIDPRTMEFLGELVQNNEREWFAKNDARYRHALQNWQQFVDAVQPVIQKGDWSIPEMPAKDLIHRIYRDVRFSNDKTPYKKNFSASFSRAGRKGPFAGYYLQISPNGRSLLAGGKWGPEKNDLATIRSNILRSPKPLRKVINDPKFVSLFGPAKLPAGKKAPSNSAAGISRRCNVFGSDDMLKVAPKINGVDKTHKDIDLLRLRTIAVVYEFKDEEVIKDTFMDRIGEVVEAMAPLVLLLNEMLHPTSEDEAEAQNDNDDYNEDEGGSAGEDDEAGGIESA